MSGNHFIVYPLLSVGELLSLGLVPGITKLLRLTANGGGEGAGEM